MEDKVQKCVRALNKVINYSQKTIKIYILSTQEMSDSINALKSQCAGKGETGYQGECM